MNIKQSTSDSDRLTIGSYKFDSRLMVGTGKYRNLRESEEAITASGAEVITVAVRRANLGQDKKTPNLLDVFSPDRFIDNFFGFLRSNFFIIKSKLFP